MKILLLPLTFFLLLPPIHAQCQIHLPTASSENATPTPIPNRILAGFEPAPTDSDNIVVIVQNTREGPRSRCVGSLIASRWVLTAAHCDIIQGPYIVKVRGAVSDDGFDVEIERIIKHEGWNSCGTKPCRDDIALVKLSRSVPRPDPSPTPPVTEDLPPNDLPNPASSRKARQSNPPIPDPPFNYMRINNNTNFAMGDPRFLRVKGFGLQKRPEDGGVLFGQARKLSFADLRTATCDDGFGNDGRRRVCTEKSKDCGPCFGDSGAPLYDVDESGEVGVLVGIVTFGVDRINDFQASRVCTSDQRTLIYTAVAHYADWISRTVNGDDDLWFYQVPAEGISNINLKPKEKGLTLAARVSIITISSIILLGVIAFLLFTCIVRHLRRKRKRWVEAIRQEESFIKAGDKDSVIVDPFEGLVEDHKPRMSITTLGRAARRGATEFSARSIEAVRAMLLKMDEEDFVQPRDSPEDAPDWLVGAWDKLFKPPSRKELSHIHKVPTQRVVDDVLEGGDNNVEPSLESVAFKSARDDANLEAAWKRLEIKTSLRNIAESSSQTQIPTSPTESVQASSPQMSSRLSTLSPQASVMRGSLSLLGSRTSSQKISGLAESNHSGKVGRKTSGGKPRRSRRSIAEIHRADTLLAAFATIDAESEQVAEETTVDPTALREMGAKRPKLFAALRRKLSIGSGMHERTQEANNREEDNTNLTRKRSQSPHVSAEGFDNPGPISPSASTQGPFSPSGSGHGAGSASMHRALSPNASIRRTLSPGGSGRGGVTSPVVSAIEQLAGGPSFSHREFSTRSASGFSANTITPNSSQNSVGMDYFSDTFSISDSSSDGGDEPTFFDQVRRYTTDRREEALPALRPLRTYQRRSFERLGTRPEPTEEVEEEEEIREVDLSEFNPDDLFAGMDILPEGCDVIEHHEHFESNRQLHGPDRSSTRRRFE